MNHQQPEPESLAVLESALCHTAAYRSWRPRDPGARAAVDERYRALPVLTKADIRAAYPAGLVPRSGEPGGPDLELALRDRTVEWVTTSGTTDEQVVNLWNQTWWDESERASWQLNAVTARVATGHHHEALLAPSLSIGPRSSGDDLPYEARRLGRFLYLNEYARIADWPEGHAARMARELGEFAPAILEGNPSFLAAFARACTRGDIAVRAPDIITFTYELPLLRQLRAIREAFPCPTASSYGSTEAGYVFMECEYGSLHQNAEFCRVDFVPFRRGLATEGVGVILVTTFRNEWTRLLRFDIGDVVRVATAPCPCGREAGLTLEAIEGRTKSLTVTADGRLVTAREVDQALDPLAGVSDYQLVQHDDGSVDLVLVPGDGRAAVPARDARDILAGLYGPKVPVTVSCAGRIEPERSGKYLYVKRDTPVDWRMFS